jgi:cytoskeletal protein CcmA (bactofilin family)
MGVLKEAQADRANPTVIGPSILVNGKLSGDEDLTVLGRVEGEITLTKGLVVESQGVVKANVTVKTAVISGVVVGNISATESVQLTKEARMVGDIHAPRIILVDGASFRGRVEMGEVEVGRVNVDRSPKALRPVARPNGFSPLAAKSKPMPPPPAARAPLAPVMAMNSKKKVVLRKKAK